MRTLTMARLEDAMKEVKAGFACGEEAEDGIFQIRMNNITRDGQLNLKKQRRVPHQRKGIEVFFLRDGDVLFNATNSPDLVGKTAVYSSATEPAVFSNHFLRLRVDESRLTPAYLARWLHLQFEHGIFKSMCRQWVNQATVSREALLRLKIPLPSLEEQRRIAEVLDRADELRAKRRQALAHLDDLTQSIFLDMFGDPYTNPRNWPITKIGDLLESANYGSSEKASHEGDLPILRMNNITTTGSVDLSNLKYLRSESTSDQYRVRAGDVLFNRTNSADLVGKTAIYRGHDPIAFAGYLIRLRVNVKNNPEYLASFLNTRYAKRILRGMCKSIIGMANINAKELQGINVAEPPLSLQIEFAARIGAVEKLKMAYQKSLVELDELFASLQDRAFKGLL